MSKFPPTKILETLFDRVRPEIKPDLEKGIYTGMRDQYKRKAKEDIIYTADDLYNETVNNESFMNMFAKANIFEEDIRRIAEEFISNKENPQQLVSTKVGRNEPCPCGSGKKYKFCCRKWE